MPWETPEGQNRAMEARGGRNPAQGEDDSNILHVRVRTEEVKIPL